MEKAGNFLKKKKKQRLTKVKSHQEPLNQLRDLRKIPESTFRISLCSIYFFSSSKAVRLSKATAMPRRATRPVRPSVAAKPGDGPPVAVPGVLPVKRKRGAKSENVAAELPTTKRRRAEKVEKKKEDVVMTSAEKAPSKKRGRKKKEPAEEVAKVPLSNETEEERERREEEERRREEDEIKEKIELAKVTPEVWEKFLQSVEYKEKDPLWKKVFYIGTELHVYPSLIAKNWDFSHLEKDLSSKFKNKIVYMFGTTEGSGFGDSQGVTYMVGLVPVINVVVSSMPPPPKVAVTSLQLGKEDVQGFRAWNLEWAPYQASGRSLRNYQSTAYHARFVTPRSRVKPPRTKMSEYQYLLPFILTPRTLENFVPEVDVKFIMDFNGKSCAMDFNLECDEVAGRAEDLCEDHDLDKSCIPAIEKELSKYIAEVKEKNKAEKQKIKKQLNAMSKAELESLKNMVTYKYYPADHTEAGTRSHYMNRSYGECNVVKPACSGRCERCAEGKPIVSSSSSSTSSSSSASGGNWECVACMTPNPSSSSACACCMTPKP